MMMLLGWYFSRLFYIFQLLLAMRNNGYFFEENDFNQEEFNPLQILTAFQELNKCNKAISPPTKNITFSLTQPGPYPTLIQNNQSDQVSNNSKGQPDSLPKKTYIIKKQTIKQHKQETPHRNQNSLGRLSNVSKSHDIGQETKKNMRKDSFSEYNFSKKNIALDDKEISNLKLSDQVRQLQAKYAKKQELFAQEKSRLMQNCDMILQQSFKKKLQFQQFLTHQNSLKECIYDQQINPQHLSQMQFLHSQETKLKTKRGKKNQTMEQQQAKNCQLIAKKGYVSYLISKLAKEKQKYGTIKYNQYQPTLSELSQSRIGQLKKYQFLKNFSLLSIIEGGRQSVEEILCMDLNKLQECTISCLKFSPIFPKNKRNQLYQSFKDINLLAKRLTSPSPNIFFPNKSNLFLPISSIFSSQDEIFIVNEKFEKYNLLHKFLNRIEYTSGEQGLAILKYILTACLKIVEQLQQQNVKFSAIVLPKCIYFNEKFQVKFKNLIFNQVIYQHFKHLLTQDQRYFFPPEQNPDSQEATIWSIGILAYHFYFGSKPFSKYNPYSWPSRQYFFEANDIQYQNKSQISDKIRQFISTCLKAKLNTKSKLEICVDLLSNLHVK